MYSGFYNNLCYFKRLLLQQSFLIYSLQICTNLYCFLYRMSHASMDQKVELVFIFKTILPMIWYDYKCSLDEIAWTRHQVGLVVIFESFFNYSYYLKIQGSKNIGLEWHNDVFSLRTANFRETTVGFQLYSSIKVIQCFDKVNFEEFYVYERRQKMGEKNGRFGNRC